MRLLISANLFRASLACLTVLAATMAYGQDDFDPTGSWDVEVVMGGAPMQASLEVTKNDDGTYSGVLNSPMGELTLENVAYEEGETLSFSESIGEGDTAMEFNFEGTFSSPDTFEGLLETSMGPMPVKGTRAGANIESPIAGLWKVISESQLGTLERDLAVYKNGTVKYVSEEQAFNVTDLNVDGNAVTFDVTVDAQGQELALSFEGTYEGDELNGEFMMDGAAVAEVTGTKSDEGGLPLILGAWGMSADTPLGELIAKMNFAEDGASVLVTDESESEITDLDVDIDFVTFAVTVVFEGSEYEVIFEGFANGDSLDGDFLMGGSPVAQVSAARE